MLKGSDYEILLKGSDYEISHSAKCAMRHFIVTPSYTGDVDVDAATAMLV